MTKVAPSSHQMVYNLRSRLKMLMEYWYRTLRPLSSWDTLLYTKDSRETAVCCSPRQ